MALGTDNRTVAHAQPLAYVDRPVAPPGSSHPVPPTATEGSPTGYPHLDHDCPNCQMRGQGVVVHGRATTSSSASRIWSGRCSCAPIPTPDQQTPGDHLSAPSPVPAAHMPTGSCPAPDRTPTHSSPVVSNHLNSPNPPVTTESKRPVLTSSDSETVATDRAPKLANQLAAYDWCTADLLRRHDWVPLSVEVRTSTATPLSPYAVCRLLSYRSTATIEDD